MGPQHIITENKINVLIAEDDFMVSEAIKGFLEELGYIVLGKAQNGRQALEMTHTLHPDVVLMDIKMPDMDGLDAAQHIHAECPTPVVILTAYDSPDLVQEASEAGVGAYLVKMPKPKEIERAVVIALARFDDMMTLRRINNELERRNEQLQVALNQVKLLSGLLPICANCKKIRDDAGYWQQIEIYIRDHSEAHFSHGLCPDCAQTLYPDFFKGD